MNRRTLVTLGLASVLLAACGATTTPTPASPTDKSSNQGLEQKQGDSTKTGAVSQLEGKYYLNIAGQPPIEIDSYGVELDQYLGKTVTVTGQYSGNTLFVGKIQE